jgi:hypothetical protein
MEQENLIRRNEIKLQLWDTPGFFQFLGDLQFVIGDEIDVMAHAEQVKGQYKDLIKIAKRDFKSKFKQGKLDL